jgi:hypothetical protein
MLDFGCWTMDLGKAAGSVLPRNCISATIFPPTCRKARIATTAADGSQDDCGSRSPWERQVFHLPGHQLRSRIFQRGRPCCRTERGLLHRRTSFAIETTLRSAVTFEQARSAAAAGFITEMRYVVLRDFAMYLERVQNSSRCRRTQCFGNDPTADLRIESRESPARCNRDG